MTLNLLKPKIQNKTNTNTSNISTAIVVATAVFTIQMSYNVSAQTLETEAHNSINTEFNTELNTEIIEKTSLPTRLYTKKQDAIAISTTILTEKELSRYVDIPQALITEANIDTFNQGGVGGLNSIFLRGSNSSQVLILLDGIPFNNFSSGSSPLSQLVIQSISKIEISRGNLSSLYGSQAMGGVIHIETKKGSQKNQISMGLGRYNRFETQINLNTATSEQFDAIKFNLYGGHTQQSGFSAIDANRVVGANADKDGVNQFNGGFNLSQTYKKGHDWQLSGQSLDNTVDYDNYGSWADPLENNIIRNRLQSLSFLTKNEINDGWNSEFKIGSNKFTDKTLIKGNPDVTSFAGINKNDFFSTQQTFDLQKKLGFGGKFYIGYEQLKQKFHENQSLNIKQNRTVNSQFIGYMQQFGEQKSHGIQLNWRQDRFSDFGTARTGLLAYQYQKELNNNRSLRLGVQTSTAFKAPTFNDLYYPNYSNPNLKPEKSRSTEMTMAYLQNSLEVQGTLFDNRYRDLVGYDVMTYLPININRANIKGFELQVKNHWNLDNSLFSGLELGGMATWQNPINQAESKEELLLRRPKRLFSAFLQTQSASKKQDFRLEYVARSSRRDFDINDFSDIRVAGFNVLNAQIKHQISSSSSLQLRLENITNRHYQIVDGYQTAGRTWFVRFTQQF